MASRKKADPAALRTIGLFTGRTVLEEAEVSLFVPDEPDAERHGHPLDMVPRAESTAVRWLGMDVFHEGDDIKVALHPHNGTAVIVLVRAPVQGAPHSTATFKLSRVQWAKLKELARGEK